MLQRLSEKEKGKRQKGTGQRKKEEVRRGLLPFAF
jgi:hypothetical protein